MDVADVTVVVVYGVPKNMSRLVIRLINGCVLSLCQYLLFFFHCNYYYSCLDVLAEEVTVQ